MKVEGRTTDLIYHVFNCLSFSLLVLRGGFLLRPPAPAPQPEGQRAAAEARLLGIPEGNVLKATSREVGELVGNEKEVGPLGPQLLSSSLPPLSLWP